MSNALTVNVDATETESIVSFRELISKYEIRSI